MFDGRWLSPFRRGLFEPLFCFLKNAPLRRYWKELEDTQHLSEAELYNKQWRRLEDMLRYLWGNNSFYRSRFEKAGITPDMIRSSADLSLIPILTKEEIRNNTPLMISNSFDKNNLLNFKTGGSTGKSLDIYITEDCSFLRVACARRHDRWTGWEVGEPIAAVWGNPSLPVGIKEKLRNWLLNPYIYLDTMNVTQRSVEIFADEWERVKPTLLFGHAHSIYILAQHVRNLNIENIKPKGILSTSMMLMPHERKLIEEVFCVKVTDRYGCEEVSLIASECERHEGMHLNIEHLIIEFIKDDGSPANPGEPGKIIVTDLMNRAMPFIRYQVEDVGVPSIRKCSCGRGFPLMESVTGRVADFLIKKDGSMVAGISLIENTLTKIAGIDQMQIIQNSIQEIILNLVVNTEFKQVQENELVEYFSSLFGKGTKVVINRTNSIEPERNGKYRFSICRIDKPGLIHSSL